MANFDRIMNIFDVKIMSSLETRGCIHTKRMGTSRECVLFSIVVVRSIEYVKWFYFVFKLRAVSFVRSKYVETKLSPSFSLSLSLKTAIRLSSCKYTPYTLILHPCPWHGHLIWLTLIFMHPFHIHLFVSLSLFLQSLLSLFWSLLSNDLLLLVAKSVYIHWDKISVPTGPTERNEAHKFHCKEQNKERKNKLILQFCLI